MLTKLGRPHVVVQALDTCGRAARDQLVRSQKSQERALTAVDLERGAEEEALDEQAIESCSFELVRGLVDRGRGGGRRHSARLARVARGESWEEREGLED